MVKIDARSTFTKPRRRRKTDDSQRHSCGAGGFGGGRGRAVQIVKRQICDKGMTRRSRMLYIPEQVIIGIHARESLRRCGDVREAIRPRVGSHSRE